MPLFPRAIAAGLALAILPMLAGCGAARLSGGTPFAVQARPAQLGAGEPSPMAPGIHFLGALELSSPGGHFGGLSSLRWEKGWLHALSDEDGAWYALRPRERGGRLVGIESVRTIRLLDSDGAPLVGKRKSDAEAMEFVHSCKDRSCPPSAALVALERDHRILRYALSGGLPAGTPERLGGMDPWLSRQPDNEGVEAMASDEQGTLLISEGLRVSDGNAAAMLLSPPLGSKGKQVQQMLDVAVPAPGDMRPSDVIALGGGRFILLRRSWSEVAGFAVVVEELRLNKVAASTRELISLTPPFVSENFEGIAVRKELKSIYIYIIADDNFEPSQRTLLLKFQIF